MKKKHDPPPVQDRLPAMFVGDEEAPRPPPISAQALVAGTPAAAMLPDDLRVTVEGTTERLPQIIVGLMAVVFGGLTGVKVQDPSVFSLLIAAGYASIAVTSAWLGWVIRPMRSRSEYRLTEEGIVLTVLHGTHPKPRVTRIRWTEIADYTVSLDGETLRLRVVSTRGHTISLKSSPPTLSTREFVRRFIVQAERHPRAPHPRTAMDERSRADSMRLIGFLGFFVASAIAEATLDFSEEQESMGSLVIIVVALGLYLWHTLDDDDIAHSDRTSQRLMARLRRWLRRVLGIRVG